MKRSSILRIAAGTAAVIFILILASWGLGAFGEMSGAGVFALTFGIIVSVGLGVALMVLVFYSSRARDEEVYISARGERAGSKPGAEDRERRP
jgi:Zn-dependent protease with chaperone function